MKEKREKRKEKKGKAGMQGGRKVVGGFAAFGAAECCVLMGDPRF
jgi:hypothetical protein